MPVGSKLFTLLSSSFHLRRITVPRLACYSRYPIAIFSSPAVFHVRFVFTLTEPVFLSRVVGHFHTEAALKEECVESLTSSPVSSYSHPWPEWSKLADLLVKKDYSDRSISSEEDDCTFLVDKDLPKKFLKDARACLGFAKERPDILSLLTKKNIEAVVLNGSPFLFKNSEDSAQRMKLFITREENNLQLEHEKAHTIDVMQYLLSYVYDSLSSSDANGLKSNQVVERFVRKLLLELFNLSGTVFKPKSVDSTLTKVPLSSEQFTPGKFTEMRSGNLIFSKFPDQTSVTSESHTSSSSNLTDVEYEKSMAFLKQGPEEESPQGRSCGEDYYSNSSDMNMNQANSTNKLNSSPHSHLGNNYRQTYPDEYIRKLTNHPPGSFQPNDNTSYGGSTVNSSTLSDNPWTHQHVPPSCNSPSNNSSSLSYSAQIATSSLSASNLQGEEFHTSYRRFDNSTTTSSSPPWRSTNNTFYGGATMNSSHPPKDSWSDYNNSYLGKGAENSTQTSSNTWDNYNRPNGGFTPYSSQNSMQPSYNSSNNRNASSKENSSQPLTNWKNYTAAYDAVPTKSTQPSNNLWSNSNSNAFQPPNNSWSNYSANTLPNSWNKKNSYVGPALESNRGFTRSTNHPSNNSWNNTRENWSGGFPRANSVTEGLPMQAQAQNTHDSGSYGCYSAKSLEGSCVKEPDPLDMSEEAKAERWFRRAAQIKDISELSQIPDEDFPQIMPMRKGVNRFVVSKRKTPLERRLVSQQYRRNFPVVSSEPEKAPAVGESDSQS